MKRQIKLRRSSYERQEIVYEEIEKLGGVAGWIGFLPFIAWSIFTGSVIRIGLYEASGDPAFLEGLGTFLVVVILVLGIFLYWIILLGLAKSIVRNLFTVL